MRRNHKNHIGSPYRPVFAFPITLEHQILHEINNLNKQK